MVPSAPMRRPGKKPAAKEEPLKPASICTGAAGQEELWEDEAGFVAEGVGSVVVDDDDGDAVSLKHMLLWHL